MTRRALILIPVTAFCATRPEPLTHNGPVVFPGKNMKIWITRTAKKIVKWIVPYMLYGNLRKAYKDRQFYKTYGYKPTALNPKKYRGYNPPGNLAEGVELQKYVDYVKKGTNIKVRNVFEIGANFAQDADYLMEQFNLTPKDIYVFEAHPELYEVIKKIHTFNAFNNAVFNEEKEAAFYTVPVDSENTGGSGLFGSEGEKNIKVQAIRMDSFMNKNNIESIDFLKIDAEGATYHILEGFGKRITDIKCLQVECEHGKYAVIPYEKTAELLLKNNFDLVYFFRGDNMRQSDSFWVRRECISYS
jgi:FkbM family methyltransferase